MTSTGENKRPIIIIKRKKVIAGGHHGGAWKVAYADFVTAMMAFFMLMWLLNATTDNQRKGLADYFSPTIALSSVSGGGDGALGGRSMTADVTRVQMGRGGVTASSSNGASEDDAMEELEAAIMGRGGESLLDNELLRHVAVRLTDEGLVIEFFDLPGSRLFDGADPQPLLTQLLTSVADELREVPNALAVEAFTAAEPVVTRAPVAWEVSSARAHALRRALPKVGIADARVVRVTGHADRHPVARDPLSARNNRVSVIVLRDRVPARP